MIVFKKVTWAFLVILNVNIPLIRWVTVVIFVISGLIEENLRSLYLTILNSFVGFKIVFFTRYLKSHLGLSESAWKKIRTTLLTIALVVYLWVAVFSSSWDCGSLWNILCYNWNLSSTLAGLWLEKEERQNEIYLVFFIPIKMSNIKKTLNMISIW